LETTENMSGSPILIYLSGDLTKPFICGIHNRSQKYYNLVKP